MHIQILEVEKVSKAMENMKASQLIELFKEALRESHDRLLVDKLKSKEYKLLPSEEVAKELGYSASTIRALVRRGYFIAVKRGKSCWTSPMFDLRRGNIYKYSTVKPINLFSQLTCKTFLFIICPQYTQTGRL